MEKYRDYSRGIIELLNKITENQPITKIASMIADSIEDYNIFHIIGTGAHGSMAAEELLWRGGGIAAVNCILDSSINLIYGAERSGVFDQLGCYAASILDCYDVRKGELLIIVNSAGVNMFSIELARECRHRGIKTIGITCAMGADNGVDCLLNEVDLWIDNYMPTGDSMVSVEGLEQTVGSVSSVINLAIVNMCVVAVVEELIRRGIEPPVWKYDYCPGAAENNQRMFAQYSKRAKFL